MNVEIIGKLSMSKKTDKFNPYSERVFDSGWTKRTLLFNVLSGDNQHRMTVEEGCYPDGHNNIMIFGKSTVDEGGNKVAGEQIKIKFKDRLKPEYIEQSAEFRKYIIDLEENGRRRKLQNAFDKVKEGTTLTSEELADLKIESEDDLKKELELSNSKRHEFISKWDYAEFIKNVIESGEYKNKKFLIRGNGSYSYSDSTQKFYENFVPTRIYLADDNAEETSTATITLLFNNESLDELSVEEKGRYYVNGYMMEYDAGGRKDENGKTALIPVPTTIAIPVASEDADEKTKKKVEVIKKKFITDSEDFREYGFVVNMINGAQKTEITDDMLTDEQKEDLEWGLITMDDIRAELGQVYGERIKEYQFVKPAKGYTKGSVETVYTSDDMIIKAIVDEDEDLFEDEEL